MLTPEIQTEILSLYYGRHYSLRAIEKEIGVSRKTIVKVIRRRSVVVSVTPGQRKSILDSFKLLAEEILKKNPRITNTAMFNRLREEGYMGGMTTLRVWLNEKRLPKPKREAFLRIEFSAGECAQVDWGEFGDVFHDGVKIHAFVMVLCFSRLLYLEFTKSERFEDFIRCHENAFRFFGGVSRECWYDNLATAVTERFGKLVRFNVNHPYSPHFQYRNIC